MSENRRRSINDRPQRKTQRTQKPQRPKRTSQPTRQPTTSERQQSQRNVQRSVGQATNRIQQIKSPFAKDQTKTISTNTRASPTAKRKLGQIPLRDRQAKRTVTPTRQQLQQQPRKQPKKVAQTQRKELKKQGGKVRKAFKQENKSKDDIKKIFDFGSKREFGF